MLNKINISPDKQKLIVYAFLTVVTLAVYWQVNGFGFVNYDDNYYITENSHIQSGISAAGFRWAFTTRYFDLWNPLIWLSFMFDYQLHGLNAGGYHLTNLILHILSTLMLFWLFNRMTRAVWKSAFVAGFFALHPLHVESVAWIVERKDVLSAFFWMLTLCLYVYYTEKPVMKRYLAVVFCFACALMSKPMVVTLPVVMILLDYWPLDRLQSQKSAAILADAAPAPPGKGKKKIKPSKEALKKNTPPSSVKALPETTIAGVIPVWQLREKAPFFIMSAILVVVTLSHSSIHSGYTKSFSLASRLANAPVAFMTYLEKTFWPYDLAAVYPFSEQIPNWQVFGAIVLIIVISAAVILAAKRLPFLFVGWFWYAITILPVIGIMQISYTIPYSMADRYHYLTSIGIAVVLAWGIPYLISSADARGKILFSAATVFLMVMALLTGRQCRYWIDSEALWNHALRVTSNNYVARNNLGNTMLEKGKFAEAIYNYNETLRLKPDYFHAYYNRGNVYFAAGQYQQAIGDYSTAVGMKIDYIDAYYNRGTAYAKLGLYQQAADNFSDVVRLNRYNANAYNERGDAFFRLGRYQEAFDDFNLAVISDPAYFRAYNNRGLIYLNSGKYQNAFEDFSKAISLKQDYTTAYINRAKIYFIQGNKELGCRDVQKVCALGDCGLLKLARDNGYCR